MAARRIEVLAAVVGAASLGAEIAATRLLAPWFGASTIVWANTIATVLVALSAGYWIGGRLADRDPTVRGLSRVVLVAAGLLAAVPFVAPPVPADLRRGARRRARPAPSSARSSPCWPSWPCPCCCWGRSPRTRSGSPCARWGRPAASPGASTRSRRSGAWSARSPARCCSSRSWARAGPSWPSRSPSRWPRCPRSGRRFALAPVALAALLTIPVGTVKATGGGRVVWERETRLPVRARRRGRRRRAAPGAQRGAGDPLALPPGDVPHRGLLGRAADGALRDRAGVRRGRWRSSATRRARRPGPTGTSSRARASTGSRSTAPSRRRAGGTSACAGPHLHLHTADARPFLRRTARRWDLIVVDAYRQPYIPFYLATKEFFALVRDHLAPGRRGGRQRRPPGGLRRAREDAHGHDALRASPRSCATRARTSTRSSWAAARPARRSGWPPPRRRSRRRCARSRRAPPRGWRPGCGAASVYTDDRAPVEWLIDASIVQVAADGRR